MRFRGRAARRVVAILAWCLLVTPAAACPVCNSGTGQQVRQGIFDGRFGYHLLVVLLPFPIFLGVALALYYGLPKRRPSVSRAAAHHPVADSQDA